MLGLLADALVLRRWEEGDGSALILSSVAVGGTPTSKHVSPTARNERTARPNGEFVQHDAPSNSVYSFVGYCTPHAVATLDNHQKRRFSVVIQLQPLTVKQLLKKLSLTPKKLQPPGKTDDWRSHCLSLQSGLDECRDFAIRRFWRSVNLPTGSLVCPSCLHILKDLKTHRRLDRCKHQDWPGTGDRCACS